MIILLITQSVMIQRNLLYINKCSDEFFFKITICTSSLEDLHINKFRSKKLRKSSLIYYNTEKKFLLFSLFFFNYANSPLCEEFYFK